MAASLLLREQGGYGGGRHARYGLLKKSSQRFPNVSSSLGFRESFLKVMLASSSSSAGSMLKPPASLKVEPTTRAQAQDSSDQPMTNLNAGLHHHGAALLAADGSENGLLLAAGRSLDRKMNAVTLLDVDLARRQHATSPEIVSFVPTCGTITSIAWDPRDLNHAAVVGMDAPGVRGYDLSRMPSWNDARPRAAVETWKLVPEPRYEERGGDGATDVSLLPQGHGYSAVVVSRAGAARLWDARAGRHPVSTLRVPHRMGSTTSCAIVAQGQGLLAGTESGHVILWDLRRSAVGKASAATVAFAKVGTQHHAPLMSIHAPTFLRGARDPPTPIQERIEVRTLRLHPTHRDRVLVHLASGRTGSLHLSASGQSQFTPLANFSSPVQEHTAGASRPRACWIGGGVAAAVPNASSLSLHCGAGRAPVHISLSLPALSVDAVSLDAVCIGSECHSGGGRFGVTFASLQADNDAEEEEEEEEEDFDEDKAGV